MLGFFTGEDSTARPLGDTSTRTITTTGFVLTMRAGRTGSNRLVTDGRASTCDTSKIWPSGTASACTGRGGGAAVAAAATTGGGVATSSGAGSGAATGAATSAAAAVTAGLLVALGFGVACVLTGAAAATGGAGAADSGAGSCESW